MGYFLKINLDPVYLISLAKGLVFFYKSCTDYNTWHKGGSSTIRCPCPPARSWIFPASTPA